MVLAAAPVDSAESPLWVAELVASSSSPLAVAEEPLSVAVAVPEETVSVTLDTDAEGVLETMTTAVPLMVIVELPAETMGVGSGATPVPVADSTTEVTMHLLVLIATRQGYV
jgi:hypothetical protein